MARRNPRRNISRVETSPERNEATGGWEVRMQRQRVKHSRFFSDAAYGGKLASLREAKQFRDEIESALTKMNVEQKSESPSSRNQSGIVGVRRHQQKDRHGDFEYHYWVWIAQWTDGHGRRRTRTFAVEKFGEDEAFRLACEAREIGVAKAKR